MGQAFTKQAGHKKAKGGSRTMGPPPGVVDPSCFCVKAHIPMEDCGVKGSWLRSWLEHAQQRVGPEATTADVCTRVVLPDTGANKCRYVDLLEPSLVSTPQFYISHAWSCHYSSLVEALWDKLQSFPDSFFWLDICAVNQHEGEQERLEGGYVDRVPAVLSKVEATLLVLDEEGRALSRAWCLYEASKAYRAKGPGGLQLLTTDQAPSMGGLFSKVDIRSAEASLESDRKRILSEIDAEVGNHAEFSHHIKDAIMSSCDFEAQRAHASTQECASCSPTGRAPANVNIAAALACRKASVVARVAGVYGKAVEHAAASVDFMNAAVGEEHPYTLTVVQNLAMALGQAGRLGEAVEAKRKVLDLRKKVLGGEHPGTLQAMNNLATVLADVGELEEAERLQHKALVLQQKVEGPESFPAVSSITNWATILDDLGKHEQALQVSKQALRIEKKLCGETHPHVLTSKSNLACALTRNGEVREAEKLEREVLQAERATLGPQHPSTLSSAANLAYMLKEEGKVGEAAELQQEVLEAECSQLGPEHPNVLCSKSNLGIMLRRLGKHDAAEQLERHTLEQQCRVMG